jgi:hypothetical protein
LIHVAIGDPQAPFETFLAILERHSLLNSTGRLRDDVQLVSMGDHFDWGPPEQRAKATADGTKLLRWLASHPAEQAVIIAGNHDLARVCELQPFASDADFERAWVEARAVYVGGGDEDAFLARYPHVPDAECIARDFSCFSVEQRALVTELLRAGRLRLAHEHRGLLLVHAGVPLSRQGEGWGEGQPTAAALNAFLDERVAAWTKGPLDLTPLHQPGSAAAGEARGILFHRPARPTPENTHQFEGPPRRRYDPRTLPASPQAIGHIRDKKARELLGPEWIDGAPARDGVIRSLSVDGERVTYRHGAHADARLYFLDCGMAHVAPEHYELFDLDARAPLSRPARSA